jgi:peptide/nickel transport system substrate-binding protein
LRKNRLGLSNIAKSLIVIIIIIIAIIGGYIFIKNQNHTSPSSSTTSLFSTSNTTYSVSSISSNITLTAGFFEDVTSLNPVNWFTISDLDVLQLIYNTLVEVNSTGLPAPGLAQRWTISDNGSIYTFYLVHNATWQDGYPVTAQDVAFTFEYWKKYHFPYYAALAALIKNVTVINNYTVEVQLTHPYAGFLLELADIGMIIPKHIWQNVTNPYNYTNLIGDGPFEFVSRTPGVDIVLKANPNYFGGKPHFEYLVIKIFNSVDSALAALQSGTLNLIELPEGTNLQPLLSNPSIHIVTTPSTMIYYISMNTQTFPFNNTLIRQAIAYAINKTQILQLAFLDQGSVANSVISPSLQYWYNPDVMNYSYNTSEAIKLLEEAGFHLEKGVWVNSQGQQLSFTLLIPNEAPWIEIATIIKQQLSQIGIIVNIQSVDPTTWESIVIGTHNYQMTLGAWRLYFDPMLFLEPSFDSNESGPNGLDFSMFNNATVNLLIQKALQSSSLSIERYYVYQIQYVVSQQVPWIMLVYGQDIWAVQGFTNWQPVPRYGLWYYTTFINLIPSKG